MKQSYPVVITHTDDGWYAVHVPDLGIDTQGKKFYKALDMARDAIVLWIDQQREQGREVKQPSRIKDIDCTEGDLVVTVDVILAPF